MLITTDAISCIIIISLITCVCSKNKQTKLYTADVIYSLDEDASWESFGECVGMYENTVVVGAEGDDEAGWNTGSAHVYELNSVTGVWDYGTKLYPINSTENMGFGYSCAIYGDYIAVGAPDAPDADREGYIYIFKRNNSYNGYNGNEDFNKGWQQVDILKSSVEISSGSIEFGQSIAIYENQMIIGAYKQIFYIYELVEQDHDIIGADRNNSSNEYGFKYKWNETAVFDFSDAGTARTTVAIFENYAVGGNVYDDIVYFFKKDDITGEWILMQEIFKDWSYLNGFAISVAIYGNYCAVGTGGNETVYVYELMDMSFIDGYGINETYYESEEWIEIMRIQADDGEYRDYFGSALAMNENYIAIGADGDDHIVENEGSVYLYEFGKSISVNYNNSNYSDSGNYDYYWNEIVKLYPEDGEPYQSFATDVAIFGNYFIVAAAWMTHIATGSQQAGNAFIYGIGVEPYSDSDSISTSASFHNLTILVDFDQAGEGNLDTTLTILSDVTLSTPQTLYSITDCENEGENNNSLSTNNNFLILGDQACVEIVFADCDDTESVTNKHSGYTILMNNHSAAIGGYYSDEESNVVCTDSNHVSYCLDPGFCTNRLQLWQLEGYSINMMSYQSMVDSSITEINNPSIDGINCKGAQSCDSSMYIFLTYEMNILCDGGYSCVNSHFIGTTANNYNFNTSSMVVECFGLKSCHSAVMNKSSVNLYGIQSGNNISLITDNTSEMVSLNTKGSFVIMNDILHIYGNYLNLQLNGYLSFYNVSIQCKSILVQCHISCQSSIQFFSIDQNCGNNCKIDDNCKILDAESISYSNNNNNETNNTFVTIKKVSQLISQFNQAYHDECNSETTFTTTSVTNENNNGSSSVTLDYGYPIYAEDSIINSEYGGVICCRGYQSCAFTDTIYSNLGHILCLGENSCAFSDIAWTGQHVPSIGRTKSVTIFCIAYKSCYDSLLQSANNIVCASYYSCQKAQMSGGKSLYCTQYACKDSLIRQVSNIYLIDEQMDVAIYSGQIGEMYVYFQGDNSGSQVSVTCSDGDICYIYCDSNACDVDTTVLTCYGKCFVTCADSDSNYYIYNDTTISDIDGSSSINCVNIDISLSPSSAPTNAPSNAPTNTPTDNPTSSPTDDNALVTQEDVSRWFDWMLMFIIIFIVFIAVAGRIDARIYHSNDIFEWKAVAAFGFYSLDFFSDILFSLKLYLEMIVHSNSAAGNGTTINIYSFLFYSSIIFIIVPLVGNLLQLHKQLAKWLVDPILKHTDGPMWILSYLKILYFVAIICGSSFSAVALFNSNLFQWRLFSMNLSRYHRKAFRNKRFFSVVLLENIPQLIIQIIALIVIDLDASSQHDTSDSDGHSGIASDLAITLFTMMFTIISIVLSVFEYFLSSKFVSFASNILITFDAECQDIVDMSWKEFARNLIFKKWQLVGSVGKVLKLTAQQIERLNPKPCAKGAMYTFAIATDISEYNDIKDRMYEFVSSGKLAQEFERIYPLKNVVISVDSLVVKKLDDVYTVADLLSKGSARDLAVPLLAIKQEMLAYKQAQEAMNSYRSDRTHSLPTFATPTLQNVASSQIQLEDVRSLRV